MKKWICCILCGMLVFSSFLVAGTSINNQQKTQTSINTSVNGYTPVLFEMDIIVNLDGTFSIELLDQHLSINNWTGADHNITIRVNITNLYNNSGSTKFYWRIAEWSNQSSQILSWIMFWVTNGKVQTQPSTWISTLNINWSAAEPYTIIKDYTFNIAINPDETFEIAMWLFHPPILTDWSSIEYTHMTV